MHASETPKHACKLTKHCDMIASITKCLTSCRAHRKRHITQTQPILETIEGQNWGRRKSQMSNSTEETRISIDLALSGSKKPIFVGRCQKSPNLDSNYLRIHVFQRRHVPVDRIVPTLRHNHLVRTKTQMSVQKTT